MRILIDIKDDNFVYNIVPKLINRQVRDRYNTLKKNRQLDDMNKYLQSNYNTSIEYVINNFYEGISVYTYEDKFIVNVGTENSSEISKLMNLIDFGNTSVKGLNIFNLSTVFINSKLRTLYGLYVRGGLIYGN